MATTKPSQGEFKRRDAGWRQWISSEEGAEFPPEAGRYHLYVAHACPWAHRTILTRALKGLQDVISVTVVHPTWRRTRPEDPTDTHAGWVFGDPTGEAFPNSIGVGGPFPPAFPDTLVDPHGNARTIREVYERAGDTARLYSVPILWDTKLKTIVNNESSEIIRMLNSEFNAVATNPDLDLYPADMKEAIEAANEWIYPGINNGVYRCGFAKSQEAYDMAITTLTAAFDRVDSVLQGQRYIAGNRFTEADVRLFVTLVRFDEVYVVYFKTNTRTVASTPAILNYCRDIYQQPGVKETINMEQIKVHYYTSHPTYNHYSIVPAGNQFLEQLEKPHNRAELFPESA